MALQLDLFQNNFEFFKGIFDKIDFHERILNLKEQYSYRRNGNHVVDLKIDMERKILLKIIESELIKRKITFDFTKQEHCFTSENILNNYIFELNIKVDSNSIRGSIGILNPERIYPYHLWGGDYDSLLTQYYNYENTSYRYCPINEKEAIEITNEILSIYFEFLEVFRNSVIK